MYVHVHYAAVPRAGDVDACRVTNIVEVELTNRLSLTKHLNIMLTISAVFDYPVKPNHPVNISNIQLPEQLNLMYLPSLQNVLCF